MASKKHKQSPYENRGGERLVGVKGRKKTALELENYTPVSEYRGERGEEELELEQAVLGFQTGRYDEDDIGTTLNKILTVWEE